MKLFMGNYYVFNAQEDKDMPKKTKLTANKVVESYGWFPPIPDSDDMADKMRFYGPVEIYNDQLRTEFHKIIAENLGFDLEADPEDAKGRLFFTSKYAKAEYEKYMNEMDDASMMPDSPEKVTRIEKAADKFEKMLFSQMAKGRFVFIPLGEKEPRQLRYNEKDKTFQVSTPLSSVSDKEIQNMLLPKDEKGRSVYANMESNNRPVKPEKPEMPMPKLPEKPADFTMKHPGKPPVFREVPAFKKRPECPKDILEDTTREEMIAKEYQRLKEEANYKEPQYIKDKPREPEFWVKPPQEVKFPEPIRENLQKPEKPKAKIDLEKAQDAFEKLEYPELPVGYYRVSMPKPEALSEPFKPILEEPDPPAEPDYQPLPDEPKFEHPVQPTFIMRYPEWTPMEKPAAPKPPILPEYPPMPELRDEPQPPVKPSWGQRFFNWNLIEIYNADLAAYQTNHQLWEAERDLMPQRLDYYKLQKELVEQECVRITTEYSTSLKAYDQQMKVYEDQLRRYREEVEELDAENEAEYDFFKQKRKIYEDARAELGPKYDEDLQAFRQRHAQWEQDNQQIIQANETLKQQYFASDEYKAYNAKSIWYEQNIRPYALDHEKYVEVTNRFNKEYEDALKKQEQLKKAHEAYNKALEPVKQYFAEEADILFKGDPDLENKKADHVAKRILENESVNAKLNKDRADYTEKKAALQDEIQMLSTNPYVIKYDQDLEDYNLNEEYKKTVVMDRTMKENYDKEMNKVEFEAEPEKELTKEELEKQNAALDKKLLLEEARNNNLVYFEKTVDEDGNEVNEKRLVRNDLMREYDEKYPDDAEDDLSEDELDGTDALNYTFVEDDFHVAENNTITVTRYEEEQVKYHNYLKQLKQYEMLEKRFNENHKKWEENMKKIEANNRTISGQIETYYNNLDNLKKQATETVDKQIKANHDEIDNFPNVMKEYEKDKRQYEMGKENNRIDYLNKEYHWRLDKEEFEKAKKKYDANMAKYKNDLDSYEVEIGKYSKTQETYKQKLEKYNADMKQYEALKVQNNKAMQEYEAKKEAYINKISEKNPKIKEYSDNQLSYLSGQVKWEQELNGSQKRYQWKNEMGSDKLLNRYFDEHEKKVNLHKKLKENAKKVTKIDPAQQKNYEEYKRKKAKFERYSEAARPMFKMLNLCETQLEQQITATKKIDEKKFLDLAVEKMYLETVRRQLDIDYDNCREKSDFDPEQGLKLLNGKYMMEAMEEMKKDPDILKGIHKMYENATGDWKNNREISDERARIFLRDERKTLRELYNKACMSRTYRPDPIFKYGISFQNPKAQPDNAKNVTVKPFKK